MERTITLLSAMALATATLMADNAWGLEGAGTPTNPYKVASASDFAKIAANISATNTGKGEFFEMTADIDFGGSETSPVQLPSIGKSAIAQITSVAWGFDGTFDGNSHTISGIYHTNNGNDAAGKFNALFSSVGADGVITNVIFGADNYVSTYNYGGTIASLSAGTISNCTNHADVKAANAFAAGICGYMIQGKGTIEKCNNYGNISAMSYACGIVSGTQSGTAITNYTYLVDGCVNSGNVTADKGTGAAGIAGSYSGALSNCTNTGQVEATSQYAAGILACGNYAVAVDDCQNSGKIVCGKNSGGIVGHIMKSDDANVAISGCSNSGAIEASATATNVGGIIGNSQRVNGVVTLTDCSNSGVISGTDGVNVGNLRGNANIKIGDGCTIASGLYHFPLDPEGTTAIGIIATDAADAVYYDLYGRVVDHNAKGIVITNGKKVLRR